MYLYPDQAKEAAKVLCDQGMEGIGKRLDSIADAAVAEYGERASVFIGKSAAVGYALPIKKA